MQYPYVILTDLSADIDRDLLVHKDIRLVPMSYTLGEEERVCDRPESDEALRTFYNAQRRGEATRTAQVSQQTYFDVFTPYAKEGVSILYLALSSGLSSTYASSVVVARQVMEKYPGVEIVCVDTLGATAGMGLLLEKAALNRDQGMSVRENAAWLEENRLRVCHWFMVDDLMYLRRGGRVSATTAVVGTALNIKPVLKILDDGTLSSFAKKRGTRAAVRHLLDLYAQSREDAEDEHVYVLHADCPDNAEQLRQGVMEISPAARVTVCMLTPIIGAHVGPGMCAIAHWGKR